MAKKQIEIPGTELPTDPKLDEAMAPLIPEHRSGECKANPECRFGSMEPLDFCLPHTLLALLWKTDRTEKDLRWRLDKLEMRLRTLENQHGRA